MYGIENNAINFYKNIINVIMKDGCYNNLVYMIVKSQSVVAELAMCWLVESHAGSHDIDLHITNIFANNVSF